MAEKFFSKKEVGFNAKNSGVIKALSQNSRVGYVLGSARNSKAFHSLLKKNMIGQSGVTESVIHKTIEDMHLGSGDRRMMKGLEGHVIRNLAQKTEKQESETSAKPAVDMRKTYNEIMRSKKEAPSETKVQAEGYAKSSMLKRFVSGNAKINGNSQFVHGTSEEKVDHARQKPVSSGDDRIRNMLRDIQS